jgi:hypothetical protein
MKMTAAPRNNEMRREKQTKTKAKAEEKSKQAPPHFMGHPCVGQSDSLLGLPAAEIPAQFIQARFR